MLDEFAAVIPRRGLQWFFAQRFEERPRGARFALVVAGDVGVLQVGFEGYIIPVFARHLGAHHFGEVKYRSPSAHLAHGKSWISEVNNCAEREVHGAISKLAVRFAADYRA